MKIRVKRVYEEAESIDGYRVLVDRLWPRGIKKENALLDQWAKDLAPSQELRKWYSHAPAKWSEFQQRYWKELDENRQLITDLLRRANQDTVTLLFAAKDTDHNNAQALKKFIEENRKEVDKESHNESHS